MDWQYKWFDKKQEVVSSRPAGFRWQIISGSCGVVKGVFLGVVKAQELGVKILWGKWMCGKRGKDGGPRAPWLDEIPGF